MFSEKKMAVLSIILLFSLPLALWANDEIVPTRFGTGLNYGLVYDPGNEIDFIQVSFFALFDYDAVWFHRAPEALRFKVEGVAGATVTPWVRGMASINMLALYFLDPLRGKSLRPYIEGGIGIIYNDFQVDGQGLRFNFNPQAGIGTELDLGRAGTWFAAVRAHHVSNGGLHKDNRGLNSVLFGVGRFF